MQGKTLYRDLWYPYGPLAPYLNSVLYRFAGVDLAVLYWAGSLSALACAVLLYLIGMQLSSWLAGWTAAAVLLGEAFQATYFSFPLPYSFGTVYGAVAACACLWCCVKAAGSDGWSWMLGGAGGAAAALLSKPEIGFGCWAAVGTLIVLRALQVPSHRRLVKDLLAVLPGIAVCVATIGWMISLGGTNFLIQQNLTGFPSTYFAKAYGKTWDHITGMAFDIQALRRLAMSGPAILWLIAIRLTVKRYGAGWRVWLVALGALLAFKALAPRLGVPVVLIDSVFLPPAMVFFVLATIPLLIVLVRRTKVASGFLALLVLVIGSGVAAGRTLFGTYDHGYSIYFNGPVVLSFLLMATWLAFPKAPVFAVPARPAETLPFLALIIVLVLPLAQALIFYPRALEPWRTARGIIFLPPGMPAQYEAAVQFMQTAAKRGEYTLSVPEDVSLYFFSGTHSPVRFYALTPGLIAPGPMLDEVIGQIDRTHVRYLIWSNRRFPEYKTPEFGKDFYQPLGDYLLSHFRPIASLPHSDAWDATIWERTVGQRAQ
jgi:hypothetical protein